MSACYLSSGFECKGNECHWWDHDLNQCTEEEKRTTFCSHLNDFCQYRLTEYCPNNHSRQHDLKPPACKKRARENLERSLEG